MTNLSPRTTSLFAFVLSLCALPFSGCGAGVSGDSAVSAVPAAVGTANISGIVHGGQQPVSGSQVYLYAAGTSGYGSASRSLLTAPGYVTTDGGGAFSITGKYSCGATDQVYLLAVGGNSGGGSNPNVALMLGLGSCTALQANAATTSVVVNEITTVASVYALSPYLAGPTALGAPASDQTGLTQAFASILGMTTITGAAPATVAGGRGTVPQAAIDSLADSMAACINSVSPFSACGTLYSATTFAGSTPADPISAVLSVALHPLNDAAAIYNLATAASPFQPALAAAPANWAFATAYAGDVLTYHHDNSRGGVQPVETTLTPANVVSTTFGKLYTFPIDGYLWTQPLYVGGYTMSDGAAHNVVFAATSHSSVYAFDADNNNPAAGYLWKAALVNANETAIPYSAYNCSDMPGESGIAGTPVIDRTSGTLYVVTVNQLTSGGTTSIIQRLHALNLTDGTEKFGGPTVIQASVPGSGSGTSGGVVSFLPSVQHQHAALLLAYGTVTIAWASHCDVGAYHGWMLGYTASNIAHQTSVYNNTPNGSEGGIWMGIGGPSADANGNIFVAPGNGTFDISTGGSDVSMGPVRLAASTSGGSSYEADYFAPTNESSLSNADNDLGTTDALLFSDPVSTFAPGLTLTTDKTSKIYVMNQAHLGGFDQGSGGTDAAVQEFTPGGSIFTNMAYFNGTLYVGPAANPLQAFTFVPGTATAAGSFLTAAASKSTTSFSGSRANGGISPEISASGTANAIAWGIDRSGANAILYAWDATNLATLLYSSSQATGSRDLGPAGPIKFSSATVGGGHVFVPGSSSLVVYGLLH